MNAGRHARTPITIAIALLAWLALGAPAVAAVLTYSTYLGGTSDDSEVLYHGGAKVAVDPAGNVYVAGATPSVDFPTTPGAERTSHGGLDVFVTKLSPTGRVLYSTYLGGPCDDVARDVAVDAAGNAYVTGRIYGGANCYVGIESGVLVAKLDPNGGVVWASKFGGRLADDSIGQAIAVDAAGQAYVAGVANSATHDFPTTPGDFGTTECANVYSFAGDAFVAKLSADGSTLLYSKILCGQGDDSPSGIAVDAAGVAYVAGSTGSSDFPMVNAFQPTRRNGSVAVTGFVAALAPDGSHLLYSTYLGGSENDWLLDVAVDAQGNAFVTGETESDDFPTTPGVLQERAGNRHCIMTCTDAFVTKIAPSGSALVYSTYLAGNLDDAGASIAVDAAGQATVVGTTVSSLFPVRDAFQPVASTIADAFVTKLSADGSRIIYSSYLGGSHSGQGLRNGWDAGWGIALDGTGNAWLAGYTESYDFPTAGNPFQPQIADGGIYDVYGNVQGDVFVAKVTGGPGIAPPVRVTVTPGETAPGATVDAAWSGTPLPAADDSLQLSALGSPFGDPRDILASWWTGGTAAGALPLALPVDLPAGWYEMRLVGKPTADSLPAVLGRSEPFHVGGTPPSTTSTTTAPPTTTTTHAPTTTTTHVPTTTTTHVPTTTTSSSSTTTSRPTTTTTHVPTTTTTSTRPSTTSSTTTAKTSSTSTTSSSTSSTTRPTTTSTTTTTSSSTTTTSVTSTSTTLAVTTTTVPASTTPCEPATCDDGDPCTVDACIPAVGCTSVPVTGFASATCTCARAVPSDCIDAPVPGSLAGRRARACGLLEAAADATNQVAARRRLKKAMTQLGQSMGIVSRARAHGLAASCASALDADLRDAKERAKRLLSRPATSSQSTR